MHLFNLSPNGMREIASHFLREKNRAIEETKGNIT